MRRFLVDSSVFITLSEIGKIELIKELDADVVILQAIADEVTEDPAASWIEVAEANEWILRSTTTPGGSKPPELYRAAKHLGLGEPNPVTGDIALLADALMSDDPIVITDDKPLRKTCKTLGIPVSGSIGVVIVAVERGDLGPDEAKDALVAMDEVGARLSARLLRKAERLIDEAAREREV